MAADQQRLLDIDVLSQVFEVETYPALCSPALGW